MSGQEILVAILFLAAVVYVARLIFKNFKSSKSCGGCGKCGLDVSNIKPPEGLS